jgi:hypothetical protein
MMQPKAVTRAQPLVATTGRSRAAPRVAGIDQLKIARNKDSVTDPNRKIDRQIQTGIKAPEMVVAREIPIRELTRGIKHRSAL